jgi:hypothetical protein
MADQGRRMEIMGGGPRDGFEDIQRLTMLCAHQTLDMGAPAWEVYGLGGEPALLAPR